MAVLDTAPPEYQLPMLGDALGRPWGVLAVAWGGFGDALGSYGDALGGRGDALGGLGDAWGGLGGALGGRGGASGALLGRALKKPRKNHLERPPRIHVGREDS